MTETHAPGYTELQSYKNELEGRQCGICQDVISIGELMWSFGYQDGLCTECTAKKCDEYESAGWTLLFQRDPRDLTSQNGGLSETSEDDDG